ncbi:hypothetical protein L3Y34_011396 [Caenorhabditis briggsae]|uniref:Uncharacterized protein n=1 Tax=Caenorhabditis briggsae TaxID=6238 RepID=A0AAE9CUE7_CAEBR|nr:hypothetical protein L3Y34_011396 [Caenorhabditis briggsae]
MDLDKSFEKLKKTLKQRKQETAAANETNRRRNEEREEQKRKEMKKMLDEARNYSEMEEQPKTDKKQFDKNMAWHMKQHKKDNFFIELANVIWRRTTPNH